MNCCICGSEITKVDIADKNYGYDTLEGKVFYRHNRCLLDVQTMFDEPENDSETTMVIITDEKFSKGKIGE